MAGQVTVEAGPKWRLQELDREPDEAVADGARRDENDDRDAERYFAEQRTALEEMVAELDDQLKWLERDGAAYFSWKGRDGAHLAALARGWAADMRSLAAATLRRLNGERGAEREWCEEAIKQAYDPTRRCITWDEWPGWADELCDEMGVKRVVLAPSVLRREHGAGRRVDVLVELLEDAEKNEDQEFRAGGLELLRHEVGERLGRPVEIHVVSELREWVWPPELLLDLLMHGVCAYYHPGEGTAW